jgi:site-specific DNA recombinase
VLANRIYDSCPVISVPAADVQGAVLDQLQTLLAAPVLLDRTWAVAKREGDEITEREVAVLLADFATVWHELFPAEKRDRPAPGRACGYPGD